MKPTTGRTWKSDVIAVLGILLLAGGITARTTAKPESAEGRVRKQTLPHHQDTGPKPPQTTEVVVESLAESTKIPATAVPPPLIEADPDALGAWILALPDAEFARLEGPAMDRWVGRIIGEYHLRQIDPNENGPMEAFLAQLNARIRTAHD